MSESSPLFTSTSLRDYLDSLVKGISSKTEGLTDTDYSDAGLEVLSNQLISHNTLKTPILDEDNIEVKIETVSIEGNPYHAKILGQPHYTTSEKLNFHIPFHGDSVLFNCLPTTYTSNRPYGRIDKQELVIEYIKTREDTPQTIKNHVDKELQNIKKYLGGISQDVDTFNSSLPGVISNAVNQSKNKLDQRNQLGSELGYRIRK